MPGEPERATLDDFDAILEVVNTCFPHQQALGGMLERWPHCYVWDENAVRNFLLIRDGGRPVSLLAYVDHTLKVGTGRIRVGGLTAVATLPTYREQGLMTRLLNRCIGCMREEGYAFSELGGNRRRYNWFGWENGEQEWRLEVYPGCLQRHSPSEGYRVAPYDGASETLDAIVGIHDREIVGLARNRTLYAALMQRGGYETWVADGPDGIAAYAVCAVSGEGDRTVGEFGGCVEGLHAIFCHLMDTRGIRNLAVRGPRAHPLNAYLFSVSGRWHVNVPRMVKILDLEATLKGFCDQLQDRCRRLAIPGTRSVGLAVAETGQQVQLNLSADGVTLSAVDRGTPVIRLPEPAMVRLLFNPLGERPLDPGVSFLEAVLPLDFFVWPLERV